MFIEKNITEILSQNQKKYIYSKEIKIKILSNIVNNNLANILINYFQQINIKANIEITNYKSLIEESQNCQDTDLVIIIYELINFKDFFEIDYFIENEKKIENILKTIENECKIIFNNLSSNDMVYFNLFSVNLWGFNNKFFDKRLSLVQKLNKNLIVNFKNIKFICLDEIINKKGLEHSCDRRMFHKYKILYSNSFLQEYSKKILFNYLKITGSLKKVIILDCDNTLWKGVIGEDGFDNIDMNKDSFLGSHFHRVQKIINFYIKNGVLICLCSKNNYETVEKVIKTHPDFIINPEEIIIKKINWEDKYKNILEISKELNILTNSFVFVDDSDFEIEAIKHYLPEIITLKVPNDLNEYSKVFFELSNLLDMETQTNEDKKRTELYQLDKLRKINFNPKDDINDYIKSLNINIDIKVNDKGSSDRVYQLLNKTNQFNMNKKHYSENEIKSFYKENYFIFTGKVKDKFGELGIVNICIVKILNSKEVEISSLIMSCRAFGRKIEIYFFNKIIDFLIKKKYKKVYAIFRKTDKNSQFEDFYKKLNFKISEKNKNLIKYFSFLEDIKMDSNFDNKMINTYLYE